MIKSVVGGLESYNQKVVSSGTQNTYAPAQVNLCSFTVSKSSETIRFSLANFTLLGAVVHLNSSSIGLIIRRTKKVP